MNKTMIIILILIFHFNQAYSEEMQMFSVDSAYSYINSNYILNDYELLIVQAIDQKNTNYKIDLTKGLANNWTFICKSSDTLITEGTYFSVFSVDNELKHYESQNGNLNFQNAHSLLKTEWGGSYNLSEIYNNSNNLKIFYEENHDQLNQIIITLNNSLDNLDFEIPEENVWVISEVIDHKNYITCVFNANTNENIICRKVIGGLSISPNSTNLSNLFPNPATSTTTIKLTEDLNGKISAVDLLGNETLVWSGFAPAGDLELDVSNLPAGIYTILINNGYKTEALKMIKE